MTRLSRPTRFARTRLLGTACSLAALALLAGCASNAPRDASVVQVQEAEQYAARARGNYVPPGPPEDPWGPYVQEASRRFDVPQTWIRAVMQVESGGEEYRGGLLTTSPVGAMGLMQVMPQTYDELRERYNLGPDPFEPHDNITAGAAYMREMYDIYGSPAFLAAYNAGPRRLDDYLANDRSMPDETRRYVAMIGPQIAGIYPERRSPAEAYAMNFLPVEIPPGLRYGRPAVLLASSRHPANRHSPARHAIITARVSEPAQGAEQATTSVALALPPTSPRAGGHGRSGFHVVPVAMAETEAKHTAASGTGWAIQVGAYGSQAQARAAVGAAKAHTALAAAHPVLESVHAGHTHLWRARLAGLSRDAAVRACDKLAHGHGGCIVVSPESQS